MSKNKQDIIAALEDAGFENPKIYHTRKGNKGWYKKNLSGEDVFLGVSAEEALARIAELPNPNIPVEEIKHVSPETKPEIYETVKPVAETVKPVNETPPPREEAPHLYDDFGNLSNSGF